MKFRTVTALSLAAMVIGSSGCQSGKLNMPGLAFWKKNDRLSPEYIEPPSHNFTPGETALADTSDEPASQDGPPSRPGKTELASESIESFAAEVNRSWEQLAEKTQASAAEHAGSVSEAMVDLENVSMPPTGPMDVASSASPLVPRQVPEGAGQPESRGTGDNQFQPYTPAPTTNYERLAARTLAPRQEVPRYAESPPMASQSAPDASLTPMASADIAAVETTPVGSGDAIRMRNPHSTTSPDSTASDVTAEQPRYESTPYQPFQPRATEMADAAGPVTDSPSSLASIPATLQLSGQGSYAPGSVRRPDPIQPENLTIPKTAGGGSFQR